MMEDETEKGFSIDILYHMGARNIFLKRMGMNKNTHLEARPETTSFEPVLKQGAKKLMQGWSPVKEGSTVGLRMIT